MPTAHRTGANGEPQDQKFRVSLVDRAFRVDPLNVPRHRSGGDPVCPGQRLGHAERVDAVDHSPLHVAIVDQIGGAIHQVAGDASAAEHHVVVVRVD